MRKLIFLLILLIFIQLSEAKTILYVTNSSTDTPCSSLGAADALYCNRLVSLGYDLKVINELHARDNSTTWNEYVSEADLIFLGSNSLDMANKNKSRNSFCGNVSLKNKPTFFAFVNTWLSKPSIEGCAFYPISIVTFNYSDNKCLTKTFKIAKEGFITEGLKVDENVTIYTAPKTAKIFDISNEGWVKAECVPPNATIDFYPVIYADKNYVFWGLDEPLSFSSNAWEIFDRAILYVLNDTAWLINAFALPSVATINQDVLIFANVTQNGKPVSGTVNFTADGLSGTMSYNGYWISSIKPLEEKQYIIRINAYSKSLRGSFDLPLNVGSLNIELLTPNFKPYSRYFLSAKIQGASLASYRILDPFSYNILFQGSLDCQNSLCNATIENMPNFNNLLLEITASGSGKVGGILKILTKESLATDKDVYKPGETIKIDLFSEGINQANLTIIKPDGTKETPGPLPMDFVSTNHFSKNYTLNVNSLNGTYIIFVKTPKEEYNKTIDVIAWRAYAYLNKNNFDVFEDLLLTVGTADAPSNLDIYVLAEITRPDETKISLGEKTIKSNSACNFSYYIPKGYPSGISKVKISLKDSFNRTSNLELNFSTNISVLQPSLFVTPSTISVTTIPEKMVEKTFVLENTATKETKIITNATLKAFINAPASLGPKEKANVKVIIDTRPYSEGFYTEKINFYSQVGDAEITVNLEIIGNIELKASEKLEELNSLENNITYLSKLLVNVTDALKLLNETKETLNDAVREYRNENFVNAKTKFDEALEKAKELEIVVSNLYQNVPDYSFVIWYFALAVVVVIVGLTVFKIKTRRKKQKVKKVIVKKEEPKEEIFFEPKGGEYRTEYY